jgi:hypothetical protein
MAKLTLWSPFVGIFLLGLLGEVVGNRSDLGSQSMIAVCGFCALFFASGIALGIKALRAMKVEGRKGIFGRALTGMVLNGLLLGVTLCLIGFGIHVLEFMAKVKRQEADGTQKAQEMAALRDKVTTEFGLKSKEMAAKYRSSGEALMNHRVLDMSSVKSRDELNMREKMVDDFIAACKALQDLAEHGPALYEQELLKSDLPARVRQASVKIYAKSFYQSGPGNRARRRAEVRLGKAMLKVITILDREWGQWEYQTATGKGEFKDESKATEYHSATLAVSQASEQLKALAQRQN